MWGTGPIPSLCALRFDCFLFPGPHCLLPGMSAEYICYCGLLWAFISWPTLPSSSFCGLPCTSGRGGDMILDPLWHSCPLCFLFFRLSLHLSRTSFSSVLISPAVYCLISLASYLLISHLTHTDSSILSLCLFPQNDLCWLFAHSALLVTVLLLCCLHQTVQCCAEDEWRAALYFSSPGKF